MGNVQSICFWLWDMHQNNLTTDNRLISEALLVADHVSIRFRCCFSSLTSLTGFWQTWLHVSACYFQLVTPGSGVLMWCYHTARGESGLIYDVYYCDILLIKQLLPDICQAAGDFCFPAHHAYPNALSWRDARLRTSHHTCGLQQSRPHYTLWVV